MSLLSVKRNGEGLEKEGEGESESGGRGRGRGGVEGDEGNECSKTNGKSVNNSFVKTGELDCC